jgi:hypothetical protein
VSLVCYSNKNLSNKVTKSRKALYVIFRTLALGKIESHQRILKEQGNDLTTEFRRLLWLMC